MRILVVDVDHERARRLVEGAEALGHTALAAHDGAEAWRLLAGEPAFDALIAAWRLPGLSGRELVLRVRERSRRYLPCFVLVPAGDRDAQLDALVAGADDALLDPVDAHDLRLRLVAAERLVALHRRLEAQADELKRLHVQLERQLHLDVVTGVPNRRRLEEDAAFLYDRAVQLGLGYSLAMIDVDRFKAYNDTYGHARGDEALRAIATRLTTGCRAGDQVYRYGGEEFVLVLQTDDPERAEQIAERVRREIERLALPHAASVAGVVTVSIGVATMCAQVPRPASDVIDRADAALYRAKRLGRNHVCGWDPVEDEGRFPSRLNREAEAS